MATYHYLSLEAYSEVNDVTFTITSMLYSKVYNNTTTALMFHSCVVIYPAQWEAITVIDELTDEQTCRSRALSPMQAHCSIYPMVDMASGHIRVDMHSAY